MITGYFSILHMIVDGLCAFGMYHSFLNSSNGPLNMLLYNFCAFALQMPLGLLLDAWDRERNGEDRHTVFLVCVGVSLSFLGIFSHPVVLGIGNALFHVAGGVGVIREDQKRQWKGRGLGVFVAPGALGLYLGGFLGRWVIQPSMVWYSGIAVVVVGLCLLIPPVKKSFFKRFDEKKEYVEKVGIERNAGLALAISCFLVVIIRSYVGMTVSFSWNSRTFTGLFVVLAVVLGKIAGGFLAARFGIRSSMIFSLIGAMAGFFVCQWMPAGLAALFFFNMTMPITLYLLIDVFKKDPGFCFGLLTFALFLGFLPVYFGFQNEVPSRWIGVAGSVLTLGLLHVAERWSRCRDI